MGPLGEEKVALLWTAMEGIMLLGLDFFCYIFGKQQMGGDLKKASGTNSRRAKMLDLLKRVVWIGAGLAVLTKEKIEETVREIVKKGHLSEQEGKELINDLVEKSKKAKKDLRENIETTLQEILQRLNIPTRKDVEELKARLERLEKAAEKKE